MKLASESLSVELSAEHVQRLNTASQPKPIFPNNFSVPDLIREKFSGGPDIKRIYKNCRKI